MSCLFNVNVYGTSLENVIKVILCASEHICSIVRYCFRSFKTTTL